MFFYLDKDECLSFLCYYGICIDKIDFYVCECFLGYNGINCEIGKKIINYFV